MHCYPYPTQCDNIIQLRWDEYTNFPVGLFMPCSSQTEFQTIRSKVCTIPAHIVASNHERDIGLDADIVIGPLPGKFTGVFSLLSISQFIHCPQTGIVCHSAGDFYLDDIFPSGRCRRCTAAHRGPVCELSRIR